MTPAERRRPSSIGIVPLLLLMAVGVEAQVAPRDVGVSFRADTGSTVPVSLQALYRRLAESWSAEDGRGIAQLARDGRVHVVLQRRGIEARLGASQLQFLMNEIFAAADEVTFRFPMTWAYDSGAGTSYAIGRRVYQDGTGREPLVDRVFVGAREERGNVVLTELRIGPE